MAKYLKNNISRDDSASEDKDMSQIRFNRWMTDDLLELQSYLKNILQIAIIKNI